MALLSETSREAYLRWRYDPVAWVREEVRGFEADEPWQIDALTAYGNHDVAQLRMVMQACAGPGKSTILALCGIHFLTFMGDGDHHPQGIALSYSKENLLTGLWKEIAKWLPRSRVASSMLVQGGEKLYHREFPRTWFIATRAYAKGASSEEVAAALAGLHGPYLLYLLDEAGAMPIEVGNAAEQGFAERNPIFQRILAAGNPISRSGLLYRMAVRLEKDHTVIRITADPEDPKRTKRVSVEKAQHDIETRGGRQDPWVMAYVLGQYPPHDFNALLSEQEVLAAMDRAPHPESYSNSQVVFGVDVAGEGGDRSVIFPRQGWLAYPPTIQYSYDPQLGTGHLARQWRELEGDVTFLDGAGGWALGWREHLRALNLPFRLVHGQERASSDREFANKRAEMWWRMAEWIKEGGALPRVDGLLEELTAPTYTYRGDRVLLQPKYGKGGVKEQIGRSPDIADALAFTFAERLPPKSLVRRGPGVGRHGEPDIDDSPLRGW